MPRRLPVFRGLGSKQMTDKEKVVVKIKIDRDVLDWFMAQGADPQAYINALLRNHMEERTKQRINYLEIQEIKRQLSKIQ